MPEAFAIVAVFFICVGVYFALWVRSRDPALNDARAEERRRQHHLLWLEERLAQARREQWDATMIRDLENELAATRRGMERELPARN